MTPLHLISRQTFLGYLFLALGLLLIAVSLVPVAIGLLSHPPTHGDAVIAVLLIGIGLAVFGAWLLPDSGAAEAARGFMAVFGPLIPSIRFGRATPPPGPPVPPPSDSAAHEP